MSDSATPPQQTSSAYHYDMAPSGIQATRKSASVIISIITKYFSVTRVVDFGCGLGDWLNIFKAQGCIVKGFDGPWVPVKNLQIPAECFEAVDFSTEWPIRERYDLAISLEVAEHMSAESGDRLVDRMTSCSDLIVFSAAIPDQGGYGHVNEQYQSYWIGRFAQRGFQAFDIIRPLIWLNNEVSWWYQQNLIVFASSPAQKKWGLQTAPFMADVVHPQLYDWHRNPKNWGRRKMLKMLLGFRN